MVRAYNKRPNWRESNGKIYLNRRVNFIVPLDKIPEYVLNLYKTFVLSQAPAIHCCEQHIRNAKSILRRYGLLAKEKKASVKDNWAAYQREYRQKKKLNALQSNSVI